MSGGRVRGITAQGLLRFGFAACASHSLVDRQ